MITYKVKKKDKDLMNTLVEKSGIKVTFTLADLENNLHSLAKQHKEVEGQMKVHQAEMNNVVMHHPEVLTVPKELKTYVYVHEGFQEQYDVQKELLDRIIEAEDRLTEEKGKIYSSLGLPLN